RQSPMIGRYHARERFSTLQASITKGGTRSDFVNGIPSFAGMTAHASRDDGLGQCLAGPLRQEEKAQHLLGGVRAFAVRVRRLAVAAGPGVAGAVHQPVLVAVIDGAGVAPAARLRPPGA